MNGKGKRVDHWLACMVVTTLACMVALLLGLLGWYIGVLKGVWGWGPG